MMTADPREHSGSPTYPQLLSRVEELVEAGSRSILGIAGAPASGKSSLAAALVRDLAPRVVNVPMDGFHLAQVELERLGKTSRKGAPDTFDAAGFVSLLQRLSSPDEKELVYAPQFHREIEEPVAGAIPVDPSTPVVIVEGNYLLLDTPPWDQVRPLLTESWFVHIEPKTRRSRLVARHERFGWAPDEARSKAFGSDEENAVLIDTTSIHADRLINATEWPRLI